MATLCLMILHFHSILLSVVYGTCDPCITTVVSATGWSSSNRLGSRISPVLVCHKRRVPVTVYVVAKNTWPWKFVGKSIFAICLLPMLKALNLDHHQVKPSCNQFYQWILLWRLRSKLFNGRTVLQTDNSLKSHTYCFKPIVRVLWLRLNWTVEYRKTKLVR